MIDINREKYALFHCGWSIHEKGIHMPSFMAWYKCHFLYLWTVNHTQRDSFTILSNFTATNFLYISRWLSIGDYPNEKSFINIIIISIRRNKDSKTKSTIYRLSFVGENYDPRSLIHMLQMNELGNFPPFDLYLLPFSIGVPAWRGEERDKRWF